MVVSRVYVMGFWLCVWLVQFSKLFVVDFVPNQKFMIYTYMASQQRGYEKKWSNGNKYNSGLCVFVPKFAILSQQYNETSIIIMVHAEIFSIKPF